MNMTFPLFLLCIIASLLSLFLARSNGGVSNFCEQGKFFDRSKQKYMSCVECKSEEQECFSCCQTELHGEGSNRNNSSAPIPRRQAKGKHSLQNAKPQPVEGDKSLPNVFVVSIISILLVGSILVLVLVVIRSYLRRRGEARECANMTRQEQSGVVIEVMMTHAQVPEHKDDTNEVDTASEGNIRT